MDISTAVLKIEVFDKDKDPFIYDFDMAYDEGRIQVFAGIAATSYEIEARYLGENKFYLGGLISYADTINAHRFNEALTSIQLLHPHITYATLKLLDCDPSNDWYSIEEFEADLHYGGTKKLREAHFGVEEMAEILDMEYSEEEGFGVEVEDAFLSREWETYEWLLQPVG